MPTTPKALHAHTNMIERSEVRQILLEADRRHGGAYTSALIERLLRAIDALPIYTPEDFILSHISDREREP